MKFSFSALSKLMKESFTWDNDKKNEPINQQENDADRELKMLQKVKNAEIDAEMRRRKAEIDQIEHETIMNSIRNFK